MQAMFTKSEMHITLPTVIMAVLVVLAAAVFAAGADTLTGGARFATVNADAIYLDGELVATTQHVAEAVAPLATTQQLADAVAPLAAHIVRTDNPHNVTAPQIGALTNETDTVALAALAAYAAYWPPNATARDWFTFVTNANEIMITGYNIAGGTDVVIPDYIHGLPVTEIGANAFYESGVTSIGGAGNVVMVGGFAFYYCDSLASVSLPQVQTVGESEFYDCSSLASVSLPQ